MVVDIPREVALKVLFDINENGAYSNIALNKHLESVSLKSVDRAFITDMVYGAVKWKLSIDWIISQFSSIRLKKISPWILNVLRLGVYQLLYTDKIPESAAVNESVNLAKKYGHSASRGFVNGVLRSISRNRSDIKYPDKNVEPIRYLSIRYSYPEWLVEYWNGLYGPEFTEELIKSNNEVPEFTVRVNTLKTDRDKLLKIFEEEGLHCTKGRYSEESVLIGNPSSISRLASFRDGLFQVQDESSMLVGKILDPRPGELVLDVCSAPGGKATHLAQLMNNEGMVIARDIHEHKIKLINESVKRLGLDIVKTELFDALAADDSLRGKADRVLVDAPCSGLGIIRRKPDIKWTRDSRDMEEIVKLQKSILAAAAGCVKPGGVLVYSTCTIGPDENDEVVKWFLSANTGFRLTDLTPYLPSGLQRLDGRRGYIQLLPNRDGVDGFFISRMERG